MTIKNLKTIEALEAFLQGNQLTAFSVLGNKTERYEFVRKTLGEQPPAKSRWLQVTAESRSFRLKAITAH